MSVDHYENFPVASLLCPPALRPAVRAIYGYARTADDIADEGSATPEERLADLAAYRADLSAILSGHPSSPRWSGVFDALRRTIEAHALPASLLTDLLSAFEQDVVQNRYINRSQLMDYCRRSANPIGRLLLHLYGVNDAVSLRQSDAICTALQLANFWQDLSVDTRRGRLYVPLADCTSHWLPPEALLGRSDSPAARRLIAELVRWTRELMHEGAPLAMRLPGRIGFELRLVIQGGLRILDKIDLRGHDALLHRPKVNVFDAPLLLWRALRMRGTAT